MFEGARRSEEAIAAAYREQRGTSETEEPDGPFRLLAPEFGGGALMGVAGGVAAAARFAVDPATGLDWQAATAASVGVSVGALIGTGVFMSRTRTAAHLSAPESAADRRFNSRSRRTQWATGIVLPFVLMILPADYALLVGGVFGTQGLIYGLRWRQIRRREKAAGTRYWLRQRGPFIIDRRTVYARPIGGAQPAADPSARRG